MYPDRVDGVGELGERTGVVHVVEVEARVVQTEVYLNTYQTLYLAMKRDLGIALGDSHDENQQACNNLSYTFHRFFDTLSFVLNVSFPLTYHCKMRYCLRIYACSACALARVKNMQRYTFLVACTTFLLKKVKYSEIIQKFLFGQKNTPPLSKCKEIYAYYEQNVSIAFPALA